MNLLTAIWTYHPWITGYFVLINAITVLVYGTDKLFATANAWRIREGTLLVLAILGGSVGALIAMQIFHHKTRKDRFFIIILAILLTQIALGLTWFYGWIINLGPVTISN